MTLEGVGPLDGKGEIGLVMCSANEACKTNMSIKKEHQPKL